MSVGVARFATIILTNSAALCFAVKVRLNLSTPKYDQIPSNLDCVVFGRTKIRS